MASKTYTFGDKIKVLMEGMSRKQLAEKTGVSIQMIGKYINKGSNVELEQAAQFAKAFGITIDDLYNTDPETLKRKLTGLRRERIKQQLDKEVLPELQGQIEGYLEAKKGADTVVLKQANEIQMLRRSINDLMNGGHPRHGP
jgi:transcriptional regulator with XRE-family HTH domain